MSPHSTRGHKCDLSQLRFLLRSFSSLAPNGEGGVSARLWLASGREDHPCPLAQAPSSPLPIRVSVRESTQSLQNILPFPRGAFWSGPPLMGWGGGSLPPLGMEDHSAAAIGATAPGPEAKAHHSHAPQGLTPLGKGIRKLCTWTPRVFP